MSGVSPSARPTGYGSESGMADDPDRDWRQLALDLLRAPYAGAADWQRMRACTWLGHPTRREGEPGPCVCTWTEEGRP